MSRFYWGEKPDILEHEPASRRSQVLRAIGVVGLAAVGHLGGVVATQAFPAKVETPHYSATASIDYFESNQATVRTPMGGVVMSFDSPLPAPAIVATPELKSTILAAYSDLGIEGLSLDARDLRPASEDIIVQLGKRYLEGVLAAELLTVGLYSAGRRRLTRRAGVTALLSIGLLTGYQAVAVSSAYNAESKRELAITGLVGDVLRDGKGVISGLSQHGEQMQKYVSSWQALVRDLSKNPDTLSPSELKEGGPTILLVSDAHNVDVGAMLEKIAQTDSIDVVINAGDLLDIGQAQEGELTGVYSGISRLTMPYLFVQGNHDKSSRYDTALRDRLKKIPNLVLLQPDEDTFTEVKIGDLRIAGVNDFTRWFGDSNTDNAKKQQPVVNAFNKVFAANPPDIAVTHEPSVGAQLASEGVTVAGHYHSASVDKNHIILGTVGGGLLEYGDGSTPPLRTYAILRFSVDCRPMTMTTVAFTGGMTEPPTILSITEHFFSQAAPANGQPRDCRSKEIASTEVSSKVTTPSGFHGR